MDNYYVLLDYFKFVADKYSVVLTDENNFLSDCKISLSVLNYNNDLEHWYLVMDDKVKANNVFSALLQYLKCGYNYFVPRLYCDGRFIKGL